MSGTPQTLRRLRMELAQLTMSTATIEERAAATLEQLGRIITFDTGWVALRDPELRRHVPLATTGDAAPLRQYFGRPDADDEVDALGLNRIAPPMLASEIPGPLTDVRAWGDHLLPAGFRQGLAVGLFASGGRHVGFLSLLSADRSHPSHAERTVLAGCTTLIADGLDRTRDIAQTARAIKQAVAGVLLTRAGEVVPLPGLPDDRLLTPGSALLTAAADELMTGAAYGTFLVPAPGTDTDLVRVTVLDFARPDLDNLCSAVLLCPSSGVDYLTVLDLQVLGLLIDGLADIQALARRLGLSERLVTQSLARSMTVLGTNDLTTATLRALRSGLRIPPGVT